MTQLKNIPLNPTPYKKRAFFVIALLLGMQGISNSQSAPATAPEMLKWSMNHYTALSSFQADCTWNAKDGATSLAPDAKRKIWYKSPNRFKVVTNHPGGSVSMTSISDGKKLVEFSEGVDAPAQSYPAPSTIADVKSMQMSHPMFCGSMLYKFFKGEKSYASLVDSSKAPVRFGPTATIDGQQCKVVKFMAQGTYGSTEVAIGTQDGLVHRIRYYSEPLLKQIRAQASGAKTADLPKSFVTTETYLNITTGKTIDPSVFVAKIPEGIQDGGGGGGEPEMKPPVPLGKSAPQLSVTGVDGKKKSLADFKGKVVLIDFWATWCPPCREGLPETQKFHDQYGKKGLAVLTVSDEPKKTVQAFIQKNHYTFPAYLDTEQKSGKAYTISGIPTTVIIDRKGKLVAYLVGLRPRSEILAALKKAGL